MNQQPPQSPMYLIRLDPMTSGTGVNSSEVVVPLHILENDVNPQLLVPYVQLSKPKYELHTVAGPEKTVHILKKNIQITKDVTPKLSSQQCWNTQSSIVKMKSPVEVTPKPVHNNFQPERHLPFYNEAIPSSSKRYTINDEIELIQALNYIPSVERELAPNEINSKSDQYDLGYIESRDQNEVQMKNTLLPNDMQVNPESLNSYEPSFQIEATKAMTSTNKKNKKLKKVYKKRIPQNYVHMSDVKVPPRAVAVLPTPLLIRGNDIYPKRSLPPRIRFGPVEGIRKVITQSEARELVSKDDAPVFLVKQDNDIIHIDVSDKDKCNWMGLLPLGGKTNTANVWLYQENDQLYGITTEPILSRRFIKLGYCKKYAEDHKLPPGSPTLDLETILSVNPKRWWCNECNRALPSALMLQQHTDVYHKDDPVSKCRMGYRCDNCRRSFTRLFSLRRHRYKYCLKKTVKPQKSKKVADKPISTMDFNSTLNNEEHRIPSDESFQNFANGLDFSASLFDTDRISNLDISGNSRADGDFNSYGISFKDDNADLGFPSPNTAKSKKVTEETLFDTSFCSQVAVKNNRRRHKSVYPSKKLECGCGHKFSNKKKLALHIYQEHPVDISSKTNDKAPEDVKEYKCDLCNVDFKRRGMLVNHLWRIHKVVSTAPMTRPVRHYPCVACPKIYRSAAKRNRHIEVNHPGAEKLRAQSIEGGVKSCEPAVCTECPRQYATRAKLLQHVRVKHPNSEIAKNNPPKPTTEAITGMDKNAAQQKSSDVNQPSFGFY